MHKTRKILVVTLVATLLGAGQLVCAAQTPARLVEGITSAMARTRSVRAQTSLRKLPAARVYRTSRLAPVQAFCRPPVDQSRDVRPVAVSPFHFRLPPPTVA